MIFEYKGFLDHHTQSIFVLRDSKDTKSNNRYKVSPEKNRENCKKYRNSHLEESRLKDRIRIKHQIIFKNKPIKLGYNPRKGICSQCNKKGLTDIHHDNYDVSNPLNHTRELCKSCHAYETWKQRKGEIK